MATSVPGGRSDQRVIREVSTNTAREHAADAPSTVQC